MIKTTRVVLLAITVLALALPVPASAQDAPPAGRIAFVSARDGNPELYLMAADGSDQRRLTTAPLADDWPAWSPDGTRLAYVTEIGPGVFELAVLEIESGATTTLTGFGARVARPVWTPDGTRIIFTSDHAGQSDLYAVNADGTGLANLTDHPAEDSWPTVSPDGTRVAFQSDRAGDLDLYVLALDSGVVAPLVESPGADRQPVWSPDPAGMRIVFVSERDGNANIFVIDSNGTNLVRLSETPGDDADPAWSPDGVFIAYAGAPGPDTSELFVINADGIDRQQLTVDTGQVAGPHWSPDGAWIAFAARTGGAFDVHALRADGQERRPLTDLPVTDDTRPAWGPAATLPMAGLPPAPSATPQEAGLPAVPTATESSIELPPPATATQQAPPTIEIPPTPEPPIGPPPTIYIPPTITPTTEPPPTQAPPPDLLLLYNAAIPSFYLVNVSGGDVDISSVNFSGNGNTVFSSIWAQSMSRTLSRFPANGCLGLWGLGVPPQPQPPECGFRHGWWESDEVVFWTAGSFTVFNNGSPVAVCEANAGRCEVSLSGTVTVAPPVAAPPPANPPAPTGADVLLVYTPAPPSFYLINTSGRRLNISGLLFQGAGRAIDPTIWASVSSGDLTDFPVGGCLGLLGLGVTPQPQPPECDFRHGWWEADDAVFWNAGSFTVSLNGAPLATCDSNAGRCTLDLP